VAQRQVGCSEVIAQMLDRSRADDWRDDTGAVGDPTQRGLGRGRANLFGNTNNLSDRRPIAIGVGILFGNPLIDWLLGSRSRV